MGDANPSARVPLPLYDDRRAAGTESSRNRGFSGSDCVDLLLSALLALYLLLVRHPLLGVIPLLDHHEAGDSQHPYALQRSIFDGIAFQFCEPVPLFGDRQRQELANCWRIRPQATL